MTFIDFLNATRAVNISEFGKMLLYSQAQVESGKNLDSGLAKQHNNIFGMQKPSVRKTMNAGTAQMTDNHAGDVRTFLKYDSIAQAVIDRNLWDKEFKSFEFDYLDKNHLWGSLLDDSEYVAYENYMRKVSEIYSESSSEGYFTLWMTLLIENFQNYVNEKEAPPIGFLYNVDAENELDTAEDIEAEFDASLGGTADDSKGFLGLGLGIFRLPTRLLFFIILFLLFYFFYLRKKMK